MSVYAERMKSHLARYKKERLGVDEDGKWRGNEKPYAHILPEALQRLNILETVRREFWRYFDQNRATLPLHTDFHHLNSSQAFAFNLFYPWLGLGHSPAALFAELGIEPQCVAGWAFEAMPDQAERTTLDVCIEFSGGTRLLVEVKLTEESFGASEPNDERRRKLREVYGPALSSRVVPGSLDETAFFPSYQLFRNVSLLNPARGDRLVLVVPRANEWVWQQARDFRSNRLTEAARPSVVVVAAEDVLTNLRNQAGLPPRLAAHAELLCEKYLYPAP